MYVEFDANKVLDAIIWLRSKDMNEYLQHKRHTWLERPIATAKQCLQDMDYTKVSVSEQFTGIYKAILDGYITEGGIAMLRKTKGEI